MHYLRNIEIKIKTKIKQTWGLTEIATLKFWSKKNPPFKPQEPVLHVLLQWLPTGEPAVSLQCCKSLFGMTFKSRRDQNKATMMYRIVNNLIEFPAIGACTEAWLQVLLQWLRQTGSVTSTARARMGRPFTKARSVQTTLMYRIVNQRFLPIYWSINAYKGSFFPSTVLL